MKTCFKIMLGIGFITMLSAPVFAAKKMLFQFENNIKNAKWLIITAPPKKDLCQQTSPPSTTLKFNQTAEFACKASWKNKVFRFYAIMKNNCGCQYNCNVRFRTKKKISILGSSECKLTLPLCPPPGIATCPTKP